MHYSVSSLVVVMPLLLVALVVMAVRTHTPLLVLRLPSDPAQTRRGTLLLIYRAVALRVANIMGEGIPVLVGRAESDGEGETFARTLGEDLVNHKSHSFSQSPSPLPAPWSSGYLSCTTHIQPLPIHHQPG